MNFRDHVPYPRHVTFREAAGKLATLLAGDEITKKVEPAGLKLLTYPAEITFGDLVTEELRELGRDRGLRHGVQRNVLAAPNRGTARGRRLPKAWYARSMPSLGTVFGLVVAIVAASLILKVGVGLLRSMGTPLPSPPPEGELRKVNLRYRCSICGAEARLTAAPNQDPDAPRHCMEDMDLYAPAFE